MAYRLGVPSGTEPAQILELLRAELSKIEQNLALFDNIILKTLTEEPKNLKPGLTVLADGTAWNPGSGAGVYTYYGSAWHKLG